MITYQRETYQVLLDEALDLFRTHSEESSERLDLIPLEVNHQGYLRLEAANKLFVFTIRDGSKLIGYSKWIVSNPLHYKNSLTVSSTTIYVLPEYRKGLLGYKFIKWSIDQIKKRQIKRILIGIKPHHDFGKLLERLGATHFEKVYSIVLE